MVLEMSVDSQTGKPLSSWIFQSSDGGPVWAGAGDAGVSHLLEVPETLRCVGTQGKEGPKATLLGKLFDSVQSSRGLAR